MSRAVLIGGFGASEEMLRPVGEAIETHFEEVDLLTLRYAESSPGAVRIMLLGAEVFVLSGGIGVTEGTRPAAVHGLDVAVKSSAFGLILKTGLKEFRMHREHGKRAREFEVASAREIFSDPEFHLRELFRIAQMDGVGITARHRARGAQANLTYFDRSAYFKLSPKDKKRADEGGVRTFSMHGQHDEPLLRPRVTIDSYLELAG